jgi:hypothetical protein
MLRRNTKPHGVTSQKTPFFIVTAVKTSNLTTPVWLLSHSIQASLDTPDDSGLDFSNRTPYHACTKPTGVVAGVQRLKLALPTRPS